MLLGGCRRGKCPTTLIDTWGRFRSTIRGNQVAIVLEDSPQLMHGPAITSASMPLGAFACLRKVRHAAAGERGGVPAPSSRRSLPTVGPENSNASIWSKPLKAQNPKTLKLLNPATLPPNPTLPPPKARTSPSKLQAPPATTGAVGNISHHSITAVPTPHRWGRQPRRGPCLNYRLSSITMALIASDCGPDPENIARQGARGPGFRRERDPAAGASRQAHSPLRSASSLPAVLLHDASPRNSESGHQLMQNT